MKMLGVSKIYTNGKITIPQDARKLLEVKDGDSVIFEYRNNSVVISKNELESEKNRFKTFQS
jgi:AbrB family looped-hinge helix DNA binding protein